MRMTEAYVIIKQYCDRDYDTESPVAIVTDEELCERIIEELEARIDPEEEQRRHACISYGYYMDIPIITTPDEAGVLHMVGYERIARFLDKPGSEEAYRWFREQLREKERVVRNG